MANASLTRVDEKFWKSVQTKVKKWIQRTDATVLVLYVPKITKRNPVPILKFEGSGKLESVVSSKEVQGLIGVACTAPAPPRKSIKEAMPEIKIQPWSAATKRVVISNLVRQYMELKYAQKRDIWGYEAIKPEWWPHDVQYISPNERRKVEF